MQIYLNLGCASNFGTFDQISTFTLVPHYLAHPTLNPNYRNLALEELCGKKVNLVIIVLTIPLDHDLEKPLHHQFRVDVWVVRLMQVEDYEVLTLTTKRFLKQLLVSLKLLLCWCNGICTFLPLDFG